MTCAFLNLTPGKLYRAKIKLYVQCGLDKNKTWCEQRVLNETKTSWVESGTILLFIEQYKLRVVDVTKYTSLPAGADGWPAYRFLHKNNLVDYIVEPRSEKQDLKHLEALESCP